MARTVFWRELSRGGTSRTPVAIAWQYHQMENCWPGLHSPGPWPSSIFTPAVVRTTLDVGATVNAIVFSPDGQRVAVAHARGLQIWDVHSGEVLQERSSDLAVLTIAFSPNGRLLAVGTESLEVQIWHADSLDTQTVLPWQYQRLPRKVAFTPDGKTLGVTTMKADGRKNREIQLWDVAGWRMRASHEYSDDGNGECVNRSRFLTGRQDTRRERRERSPAARWRRDEAV